MFLKWRGVSITANAMMTDKIFRWYFMEKSFHLMIDDWIKSVLSSLNYNIGAFGREEYKGNKKEMREKLISFFGKVIRYV